MISNVKRILTVVLGVVFFYGCDSGVNVSKFQIVDFNGHSYVAYDGSNYDSGLVHNPDCVGNHK